MSCRNLKITCLWMCFTNAKNFSFLGLHHHSRNLKFLEKALYTISRYSNSIGITPLIPPL
jgi:hypothetical protein